jgi:SAM-dependent methyltransferase
MTERQGTICREKTRYATQAGSRRSWPAGRPSPKPAVAVVFGVARIGGAVSRRSGLIGAVADFDDPAFFGNAWAQAYPDLTFGPDPVPAVEFLAALADDTGRVLELGIGGGRVAEPLARRGIRVEGIEASEAVLDRLRGTPACESIPVTLGDMADVSVDGPFRLVYLVWDGLFHLPSQARQVDCFRNVARVLAPGGVFVVECSVPIPELFDRQVTVNTVAEDWASMTLTSHDRVAQRIFTHQLRFTDGDPVRMFPVAMRYCWPSELDLMAELAGLRRRERYADWRRTPFSSVSRRHISVYELPNAKGSPQRIAVSDL